MPDSEMIAEDISYDPKGKRFFITSVRKGRVFSVAPSGAVMTFVEPAASGWGMVAVAVDSIRSVLWVTTRNRAASSRGHCSGSERESRRIGRINRFYLRIRNGKSLETLVEPGELMAPQGPAVSADSRYFYVADYTPDNAFSETRQDGRAP